MMLARLEVLGEKRFPQRPSRQNAIANSVELLLQPPSVDSRAISFVGMRPAVWFLLSGGHYVRSAATLRSRTSKWRLSGRRRWNSPFYGIQGQGWLLSFHCLTKYVKVASFRGTSLRPLPPGESKNKDTRYLDIHEGDKLDEGLVASRIRQASELPGWEP